MPQGGKPPAISRELPFSMFDVPSSFFTPLFDLHLLLTEIVVQTPHQRP